MWYINFEWTELIPQKVKKVVAIVIPTIPLALKVHFDWAITDTFKETFDL